MLPTNVSSILVSGINLKYTLLKCAFGYAEQGLRVWFISPQSFSQLPEEIVTPDKDILKLITFLYLEDYKDLINHTNGIHAWHHMPNVIILNNYEHYCSVSSDFNDVRAAFVTCSLLDAARTCSHKHSKSSVLLACFDNSEVILNHKLKILVHTYFQHLLELDDVHDKDNIVENIMRLTVIT